MDKQDLKDIIERGLREGMKRYKKYIGDSEILCAKSNMMIRAQLAAIKEELAKAQKIISEVKE